MADSKVDTVTYGKYVARVEFDEGCGAYFGCVVNLSNPITFMARERESVDKEFEKAVKAYLDECKTQGVEPEEPDPNEY